MKPFANAVDDGRGGIAPAPRVAAGGTSIGRVRGIMYGVLLALSLAASVAGSAALEIPIPAGRASLEGRVVSVQVRRPGAAEWTTVATGILPTVTWYTVAGLDAGTAYEFRLAVDDGAGGWNFSEVAAAMTPPGGPVIVAQPADVQLVSGGTTEFRVAAAPDPGATFQWYRNGRPISGATGATLTLSSVGAEEAGTYFAVVSDSTGSTKSRDAVLGLLDQRISNFSIRAVSGSASETLIVGFAISGGPKRVLVRGIGPALEQFGVSGAMPNPEVALYAGSQAVARNDNWSTVGASLITAAGAQVGAFPLPENSRDAALLSTLPAGAYTVQTTDVQGGGGVVLAEVYDADPAAPSRLVNVSARARVEARERLLIGGFVITGPAPTTVLLRAVGPGLAGFGVAGALADPRLEVIKAGDTAVLATNDGWRDDAVLATAFAQVGAFALPRGSADAALVLSLPAGSYTGVVSSASGGSGTALLEVYPLR